MATQAAFMPGTQAKPKALEVVWSWLTTVDHKRIGILYGVSAYVFFLVGGVEALLMRLQLAKPDGTVLSAQTFNELFTMHGTTMIFLAIMPMGAAFFNFIIPLQIGARDVAFPRLNALSYWVFLSGALFLHSSFLAGSIPDAGWFGYANLTTRQFSPGSHVDFWMLGLQILGLSSLMAGFNFIVTIINMRAPGMTLMRLPLFIWMSFVVQFLAVDPANGRAQTRHLSVQTGRCLKLPNGFRPRFLELESDSAHLKGTRGAGRESEDPLEAHLRQLGIGVRKRVEYVFVRRVIAEVAFEVRNGMVALL